MSTKSVLSVIFAASLIFTAGCASGKSSDNNETTVAPETTAGSSETSETEIVPPDIEAIDCGGRDYVILNVKGGDSYTFPYSEVLADEMNGDTINDAIYSRNLYIEEKYNLNLVSVESTDVYNTAKKAVVAGDQTYDIFMPRLMNAFTLTLDGCLINIADIPHIDVQNPWWRAEMLEDLSVDGYNYFLCGDLNLSMLNDVGVVYFNKRLADEYSIDDIYQTVRDGNWTLDAFSSYCKGITNDINGDGELNGDDMFGLTCNAFVWEPLFYGADSLIIEKDDTDIPYLSWDSEKNIAIFEKLVALLNDKDSTILVNQFPELQDAGGWGNASIKMFSEDRALFWIEVIYGVPQLRDMNADFGLLPMPKFDENQAEYTSYAHPGNGSACCVPIINDDLDLAGRILEDMAYQSYLTVRPAYYDITLVGKYSRDNESAEMLDIIYDNIKMDIAMAMISSGLPVDNTMRTIMINGTTDFVSVIASQKNSCENTINKSVESILALEE